LLRAKGHGQKLPPQALVISFLRCFCRASFVASNRHVDTRFQTARSVLECRVLFDRICARYRRPWYGEMEGSRFVVARCCRWSNAALPSARFHPGDARFYPSCMRHIHSVAYEEEGSKVCVLLSRRAKKPGPGEIASGSLDNVVIKAYWGI